MNDQVATSEGKSFFRPLIILGIVILLLGGLLGLSSYQKTQVNNVTEQQQTASNKQQAFILSQEDVINTNWLHSLNPLVKNVQGRLLWSSQKQLGFTSFKNLPKVNAKQSYHLYLYDLGSKNNKAIEVAVLKPATSGLFETSFEPMVKINSPLKFELILEEEGVEGQPLLFAQP